MKTLVDLEQPTRDHDIQNLNEKQNMAKKIKNFVFNQKDSIGKGYSSCVYKGINQTTKQQISVKVVELMKIKNQVQRYLLNNQMKALRKFDHPNILKCYDILMTKNNVYIVTEYCKNGDLSEFIKQNGRFPEAQVLKYAKDILEGYSTIEQNKIIHRDLKTSNIFLHNGIAKIADFGFCQFLDQPKPNIVYNVGSPAYMSPESYLDNVYSNKSDIWSIGIVIFEMLVGESPYKKMEYKELSKNLTEGILGIPNNIHISESLKNILCQCFKQKLNERIQCKKLIELINNEIKKKNIQQQQKSLLSQNNIQVNHGQHSNHQNNHIVGLPQRNSAKFEIPNSHSIIFNYQKRALSPQKHLNRTIDHQKEKKLNLQANINLHNNPNANRNNLINITNYTNNILKEQQSNSLKSAIEYIMFLYRVCKMIGEGVNMPFNQLIINVLHIIKRNEYYIYGEYDSLMNEGNVEIKKQYEYLKSRFNDMKTLKLECFDLSLKIYDQRGFRNQNSLIYYCHELKNAINQVQKYLFNQNQINQVLAVAFDYLILYYEFLYLHKSALSVTQIVKQSGINEIIKQKPKVIKQSHIKLLKIKKQMIVL